MDFFILHSIVTFIITIFVAKYFVLGNYNAFQLKEMELKWKYERYENLIHKIFNFKLFYCESCVLFWLNLISNTIYFNIVYSFIISLAYFLIHKYIIISWKNK